VANFALSYHGGAADAVNAAAVDITRAVGEHTASRGNAVDYW
jgi:hypothetical protein